MEKKLKLLILFDFDGTLADTFESGSKLINEYAEKFGYQKIDFEKNKSLSAKELIKLSHVHFWQIPKLVRFFREKSQQRANEICAFTGMPELVKNLVNEEVRLGIVSTNSRPTINTFLEKYGISDIFDYMQTEVSLFGKKRALKKAKRFAKKSFEKVIYIGDEVRDIEACQKAEIPVISVSWGFNSEEILEKKNPGKVVKNADELSKMIREME